MYLSIFNVCASLTFYWIDRSILQLRKIFCRFWIKKQRNLDLTKVIRNIFHKYNLAFKLFLLVITIWYFPTLCCFIEITSEHIGYRKMTEIISLKYGVNISKEHVRKRLFDIGLEGVSMRKKKTIKRRTYETNGPFDVFHIDGNYKWKGLVSSFASVLMDLVGSWFGFLFQPQIMILLLLQISTLKLLQIWAEHQIHCEWTWVQKTFIVKNFKYFSLKTVTVFCTLHQPGTSE